MRTPQVARVRGLGGRELFRQRELPIKCAVNVVILVIMTKEFIARTIHFVFGVILIYGIGFAEGGLFTDAPSWEPR